MRLPAVAALAIPMGTVPSLFSGPIARSATPTPLPDAMAVDADPSTEAVGASTERTMGLEFGVSTNVARADVPYAGGMDVDGDTLADTPPDGLPDGREYDRSPGLGLGPVTGTDAAGPPDGVVNVGGVLGVLAQAFVIDCSGLP